MYVAVKGGEAAILNSYQLLARQRRGDASQPELSVPQIRQQLKLAVDRVMTEGSLYDPDLAALACVIEAAVRITRLETEVRALRLSRGQAQPHDSRTAREDRAIVGQSEAIRAIAGADGGYDGAVSLAGKPVKIHEPVSAWAKGLAFLPRERQQEGLVASASIAGNVSLPHLDDLLRFGLVLDRQAEAERAVELGRQVKLKASGPRQKVRELSGGNQQKVVFARAIAGDPDVLLLDEPTRGVDVGARYDIHTLLRQLTAEGKAVVLASSDLPELVYMADRVVVFRGGKVAATVATAGLDETALAALCFGSA